VTPPHSLSALLGHSRNGEQRTQRSNLCGQWTRRNPWFIRMLRLSVSLF